MKFPCYGGTSRKRKSQIKWINGYCKDIAGLEEFSQLADVGFCTHLALTMKLRVSQRGITLQGRKFVKQKSIIETSIAPKSH